MKSNFSYKEVKRHGSSDYAFEKYDIISDSSRQFATNHWHDETEIIYVTKGCIDITVNGEKFIGKQGDIFIVNGGEMHEIYGTETPLEYTALVFDFGMLSFRRDDLCEQKYIEPVLNGKIKFQNHITSSEKAYSLLRYAGEINTSKSESYTLLTKALLLQFFALMIEKNQISVTQSLSSHNELLKNIIRYLDENYTDKLSLYQTANHFNMSGKYFCRFFKNNFNKTFVEYLNDIRIEHSIHLLSECDMPITEVAISCGFYNMSYFTLTFKKKIGCTPSQYRKSVKLLQ